MRRPKKYKSPIVGHYTDEQWKEIQAKQIKPVRAEPRKQEIAPVKEKVMRRPGIR